MKIEDAGTAGSAASGRREARDGKDFSRAIQGAGSRPRPQDGEPVERPGRPTPRPTGPAREGPEDLGPAQRPSNGSAAGRPPAASSAPTSPGAPAPTVPTPSTATPTPTAAAPVPAQTGATPAIPDPRPTPTPPARSESAPTPAPNAPAPGPGPLDRALETLAFLAPDALTYGIDLPRRAPINGSIGVSMPVGAHGVNGPFDFTTRDGTPANSVTAVLRQGPTDWTSTVPVDRRSVVTTMTIDRGAIADVLAGEAPLVGEGGLFQKTESGFTNAMAFSTPTAFRGRLPSATLTAMIRRGVDFETQTSHHSVTIAGSVGVLSAASVLGQAVSVPMMRAPLPQVAIAGAVLAGASRALGHFDDTVLREHVGTPTVGAAYTLSVRHRLPEHPEGPGFDGVYKGERRIGFASDIVAAEDASPLLRNSDPRASLAARTALHFADGAMAQRGLPTFTQMDGAVPAPIRAELRDFDRDLGDAWRVGTLAGRAAAESGIGNPLAIGAAAGLAHAAGAGLAAIDRGLETMRAEAERAREPAPFVPPLVPGLGPAPSPSALPLLPTPTGTPTPVPAP